MLEARTEAIKNENAHTRTTRLHFTLPQVKSKALEGMKAAMMGVRKWVEDQAVLLSEAFSLAVGMIPYQLLVGSTPPLQLKAFCTL